MMTLLAFLLALGILIVVHEFGHFIVARWCGVKVLRFSVGFGKPFLVRRFGADGTEWALAAFPLGGYVKMLDEREGPVAPEEQHRAFNRRPVMQRIAVVAAGPVANLILAVLIYWGVYMHGVDELRPIFGKPVAESPAAFAGFAEGETALNVDGEAVVTWQDLRWLLLKKLVDKSQVRIEVINDRNEISVRNLDLSGLDSSNLEGDPLARIGVQAWRPRLEPVISKLTPGGVADVAGLHEGDRVLRINGRAIAEGSDMVSLINQSAGKALQLDIQRQGQTLTLQVVPAEVEDSGRRIGRIGIGLSEGLQLAREKYVVQVRHDVFSALTKAVGQTWETASFSLKMMGRMVTGQVSWRNLSGPVTIAEYAGKSASMGLSHYLNYLALISISLGVLNLLPIPLLDGGHLMYYTAEIFRGRPVSDRAMEIGQQIGLAFLVMLMAFAFYNDINRLVSG